MPCEFCHRDDCGVCTDCDVPHSKCLPCRGGATPTRPLASGTVPQTARCANCKHTAAVHSLDGHCLLAEKAGQPNLRMLQMAPSKGWKHCGCKVFRVGTATTATTSAPAPPVETEDEEDEDTVDAEDTMDPSELDVVE